MNNPERETAAACKKVVAAIQRLLSLQPRPVVVALDGGSGAGKSTLASWMESKLNVTVIPLDDFFAANIPDGQWDVFSVEEKLNRVFDWARLRENAVEPLLAGQPARWRPFDFQSGLRPDGTYGIAMDTVEKEPADVLLIEGAYAAHPALDDLIDLAVLIDVPTEERHTRLEAREDKDFLAKWHARWDAVEEYYFDQVRPKNSFDLVV